ncbi:SRPBCC family protein [Caballeronia novacaledonica]|uniref:CoxG family protein n=1 Tax=Caballeronia novacaledonica TaxID=1544861 RepID=UPI001EE37070|nr:SRPBCC family protein [Caballeronia novacaledonica]GJH13124.1 SRPBCC family protein [Caballeronia novacaledonica]
MDFEKRVVVDAPITEVWGLLLDPQVMAGCVPGTESVEVLSDTEYLATVKVKISFISARFTTRTTVLETRPPYYLKSEGTGEDSKVGSSLKQSSELTLAELPDERTEVTMKIKVEVFGRLGSFGLTVMKTKADRMWEEFGANLNARARAGKAAAIDVPPAAAMTTEGDRLSPKAGGSSSTRDRAEVPVVPEGGLSTRPTTVSGAEKASWWTRLMPGARTNGDLQALQRLSTDIYIEVQKEGTTVRVLWPAQDSRDCVAWLKDYLK